MTNKKYVLLSLFILTLCFAYPVKAEDNTPTPTVIATPTVVPVPTATTLPGFFRGFSHEFRRIGRDIGRNFEKEDRRLTHFPNITVTPNPTRAEFRREHAQNTITNLTNNFNKRYTNLANIRNIIAARIQTRATTQDETQATAKLTTFDSLANTFQTDLASFTQSANQALGSSLPASIMPSIRSAATKVQTDLSDLRQVLIDAIRLMIRAPNK